MERVADAHGARPDGSHKHALHDAGDSGDGTLQRVHRRDHRAIGNSPVIHGPSGCTDDFYEWAYSHGYRPSSWARYLCQGADRRGAHVVPSTEVGLIRVSS